MLSQEVNGLLQRMISAANPYQDPSDGDDSAVLDEAAERIADLADTPQTAAALHGAVGTSYRGQGRFEEADAIGQRDAGEDPGGEDQLREALSVPDGGEVVLHLRIIMPYAVAEA